MTNLAYKYTPELKKLMRFLQDNGSSSKTIILADRRVEWWQVGEFHKYIIEVFKDGSFKVYLENPLKFWE